MTPPPGPDGGPDELVLRQSPESSADGFMARLMQGPSNLPLVALVSNYSPAFRGALKCLSAACGGVLRHSQKTKLGAVFY